MDILKRDLAPITPRAWQQIDEAVRRVLVARLCGRRVVDVTGPEGLDKAAVNLGRLDLPRETGSGAVRYGIRRVRPLVETRVDFEVDLWKLDDVERGARAIDLQSAEEAARAMTAFEDAAIFNGFAPGDITGLTRLEAHAPVGLTLAPAPLMDALVRAVMAMEDAAVEGPYDLVAGPAVFKALAAEQTPGYPLRKQVLNLIGGRVHYGAVVDGALLVSTRGGDFELTLGLDLSVGYGEREGRTATLFITESFTFQVLDPAGALHLPLQDGA